MPFCFKVATSVPVRTFSRKVVFVSFKKLIKNFIRSLKVDEYESETLIFYQINIMHAVTVRNARKFYGKGEKRNQILSGLNMTVDSGSM